MKNIITGQEWNLFFVLKSAETAKRDCEIAMLKYTRLWQVSKSTGSW